MAKKPKCSHCGAVNNLIKYSSTIRKGVKYQYFNCRKCNAERARAYRKTTKGRSAAQNAWTKYVSNNPLRKKAWIAAQRITAQPCEKCGTTERVHKHHPDPAKPLDVVFLCPLHHKQAHKRAY